MWKKRILWSTVTFCGTSVIWYNRHAFYRLNASNQIEKSHVNDDGQYIWLPGDYEKDFSDDISLNYISSIENYSTKHWNLLFLAKSKKKNVRHKAVKALSQLRLHDWQYKMIAQACDPRTAFGLAKSTDVDSSIFLSPPFKNFSPVDWRKEFSELLNLLSSFSDAGSCAQHLALQAVLLSRQFFKKDEEWNCEFEDYFKVYHTDRTTKLMTYFDKVGLQAILEYSAVKSFRKIMQDKGIFKLLYTILQAHEEETEFHSLIAQILANFALEKTFERDLHLTGWIGVLAEWCKSSNIEVSLPASKAVANIDTDDFNHCYYDNGVYLLHPTFRSNNVGFDADIIFVHGLLGATFWTWRQHDSVRKLRKETLLSPLINESDVNIEDPSYTFCWPKDWLSKDIPNVRLISVDYNSRLSKWKSRYPQEEKRDSLDAKSNYVLNKLLLSKIGEKPIIWITHSMGGLLVKQLLLECMESSESRMQSIALQTKGVIFFSVPHKGSDLVKFLNSAPYIFQPSIDVAELPKGSNKLLALNEKFETFVQKRNISSLSFGETKKTKLGVTSFLLVTEDSADPGFGEFYALPVDHLSTCKLQNTKSDVYQMILKFLTDNIPSNVNRSVGYTKLDFEISNIYSLIS